MSVLLSRLTDLICCILSSTKYFYDVTASSQFSRCDLKFRVLLIYGSLALFVALRPIRTLIVKKEKIVNMLRQETL